MPMPFTRDGSRIMLNSLRLSRICTKNVTRPGSRKNDLSSYMLSVTGASAIRGSHWCNMWSLLKEYNSAFVSHSITFIHIIKTYWIHQFVFCWLFLKIVYLRAVWHSSKNLYYDMDGEPFQEWVPIFKKYIRIFYADQFTYLFWR